MSRFQRDLKKAEAELDLLDKAVIMTYEASLWGEQALKTRWPDDRPLRQPATLDQMLYLCDDRLTAARHRSADYAEHLFRNIMEALRRIQSDIPPDPAES
jgi:hypothetical protein